MTLPAATIAEGVLGLEGIHTANSFALNDLSTYPQAKLRRILGLHSKELDDASMPASGRVGEISLPSLQRGKTVTYEGELRATSLPSLRTIANDMRGAFQQDDTYTFVVAPPVARGGASHFFGARVLQLTLDDEQTRGPSSHQRYSRAFVLAVRQYDPRYYVSAQVSDTGNTPGSTATVVNDGTAPSEPTFNFPGDPALDQVEVRNQTTGRELLFTGLTGLVDTGETFRIDFGRREVYNVQTGDDLSGRMDVAGSDWWDEGEPGIIPGTNVIWGGGTGTVSWDVAFYPANW
jgi:hypothetical protein